MPDGQVVMAASRAPFADLKDEPRSSSRIRAVPSGQLKRCWGTSRTVACRRSVARHGPIRAVATRRARIPLVSGLFVLFYGSGDICCLLRCVVRNKEQQITAGHCFCRSSGAQRPCFCRSRLCLRLPGKARLSRPARRRCHSTGRIAGRASSYEGAAVPRVRPLFL